MPPRRPTTPEPFCSVTSTYVVLIQDICQTLSRVCLLCVHPPAPKNICAVEMIQRRAARFVTGEYRRTSSVSALIKTLGWHSLAHRRAMSRVTMLYRVTHDGLVDIPQDYLTPVKVTTRGSAHHFSQVHTRVMAYKHSTRFFQKLYAYGTAVHSH